MKKWLNNFWHEIKQIESGPKQLREFGWVMGGFFGILAGIGWWRGRNFLPFLSICGIFCVITYLNAQLLKPLQKAWMAFAVIMGYFMTRILLTLLFFIALTPISLIARLTGKKFLDLTFDTSKDTYWIQKPSEPQPKEHYERQF